MMWGVPEFHVPENQVVDRPGSLILSTVVVLGCFPLLTARAAIALEQKDTPLTSFSQFPIAHPSAVLEPARDERFSLHPSPDEKDSPEPKQEAIAQANDLIGQQDNLPTTPQQPTIIPTLPDAIPETPDRPPTEPPPVVIDPQQLLLETLTNSAERYPYITDPTDNLTFSPPLFRPNRDENYSTVDLRFAEGSPVLNQFSYGHFPQDEQFYWVLPGNRVVIETRGWQGGVRYQGRSQETELNQLVTLQQVLWGTQAIWTIPRNVISQATTPTQPFSIIAISGELTTAPGTTAGPVIINSGFDMQASNITFLTGAGVNSLLGSASTYSPIGGASLFQYLTDEQAPLFLQGFPTIDLSPLLDGGNVDLRVGAVIPNAVLEQTGISWGNIYEGIPAEFTAPVTSVPGIKIGRLGRFDNLDLLNILVNPYLGESERLQRYLNSLFWTSFGIREPQVLSLSQEQREADWYRGYLTRSHNRTLIEYDPIAPRTVYTNLFSNPGASLVLSLEESIDGLQSLHGTVGLAMGGLFEAVNLAPLNESLAEAREAIAAGSLFTPLETQATPEQRRQINQRLNRTLAYATFSSGLEQVSGRITLPSPVTPDRSRLFRLQTGLHRRQVSFLGQEITITEGATFISQLDLSSQDFGLLTFIGVPGSTVDSTVPENESFAVEVILARPEGEQFVFQGGTSGSEVAPLMIRGSDLAFDRIELTRVDQVQLEYNSFRGYLSLPAVEATLAGSWGDLNYSLSSGLWINFDAAAAPTVQENTLGEPEPSLGLYTNALVNLSTTRIHRDAADQPIGFESFGPLLRVNWDSTENLLAALSYSYTRQNRLGNWSLTPGLAFVVDGDDRQWIGFLNGTARTATGLEISAGLEVNEDTYYNASALQSVDPRLSLGVYAQNFSFDSEGIEERSLNFNAGVLLRYRMDGSSTFLEVRLGTGDRGFDSRIEGEFRF